MSTKPKTDDEWADSISHAMEIASPDECEIGGVHIEVGSVWMLFFHRPDRFPATAGVASRAGTVYRYFGFRLLGGKHKGRWVPAMYIMQVDPMGAQLESIFRLGGGK